jgi:glycosyltransferase involved in cell wall biosynthesis
VAKTVLICSNIYPPKFVGGAELVAHYQAKLLKQRGHNVIVFAGEDTAGAERYSIRQDFYEGLTVFRVGLQPQDFQIDAVNFSNPEIDAHFDRLLDAFSPDVVHMHNIKGLSAGIIQSAKRRSIKTVMTLHDYWGFCYKNTLLRNNDEICQDYTRCAECLPFISDGERQIPIRMRQDFMKLQLSDVDVFISPSLYLAETYVRAGIPVEKMKVIWNGVDVARFSSLTKKSRSGTVRYTFIGHFGPHKGINVILDALHWGRFSNNISMNLVGSGELAGHVREGVRALGLGSIVKFWGKVDNPRIEEVFKETDVLVLPSVWPENQPVSITEAMAARTPVIASAIGGIPELVVNGYNGYLFQPGSAADLAGKMSEFIANPERIKSFGENGFKIIRDKSFEQQLDKICSVYE